MIINLMILFIFLFNLLQLVVYYDSIKTTFRSRKKEFMRIFRVVRRKKEFMRESRVRK